MALAEPSAFGFDVSEENLENTIYRRLHISASTLMAYAFDLNKEENSEEDPEDHHDESDDKELEFPYVTALVPPADILNADEEHNVGI